MHYKNGRAAKAGDKVVNITNGIFGILHSPNPGSETCNARLAPTSYNDAYITVGECLHVDDIAAADIPDTSKG